jgi:septum formation protein
VVLCNKKILEKPRNKKEAEEFLKLYAKYPDKTVTAISVTNTVTHKQKTGVSISTIWFPPIPSEIVKKLLQKEYTLACAGGFSIEKPLLKKYILNHILQLVLVL